jgi:hypothetical protein
LTFVHQAEAGRDSLRIATQAELAAEFLARINKKLAGPDIHSWLISFTMRDSH